MVAAVLGLSEPPRPPDVADALALAACHLYHPTSPAGGGRRRGGGTMIASLRGVLVDRPSTGEVIVEVGGVGYRASVPTSVWAGLGGAGSECLPPRPHPTVREGRHRLLRLRPCRRATLLRSADRRARGGTDHGPGHPVVDVPGRVVHCRARGRHRHPVPVSRGREEDGSPPAASSSRPGSISPPSEGTALTGEPVAHPGGEGAGRPGRAGVRTRGDPRGAWTSSTRGTNRSRR